MNPIRACRAGIAAMTLIVAGLGSPCIAEACSCPPTPPPAEALPIATAVFEGVAVDKWIALVRTEYVDGFVPATIYRFRVARGWKGVASADVVLTQGLTNCDLDFAIGTRYLLFPNAQGAPPRLTASGCMPYVEGADIPSSAAALGTPTVTYDGADHVDVPSTLPLSRRLRAYFVIGAAVYSWLSPSQVSTMVWGNPSDPFVNSDRGTPLRYAWCSIFATGAIACASVVSFTRRKRRRACGLLGVAGVMLIVAVAFVGHTSIRTNPWYESVLSWAAREQAH